EAENRALYSMERLAGDLHELLGALGLGSRKIIVAGHSMGGRVALTYFLKYPDRVAAIIAMSTNAGYPAQGKESMSRIVTSYKEDPGSWTKTSLLEGSLKLAYSRKYYKEHIDKMELEAERRLMTSKAAMIYTIESMALFQDLSDRLNRVKIPVLVIHGKSDGVISWQSGKFIADSIPGSQALIIEKASHQVTEENKELVLDTIKTFLQHTPC
nr:alpha/beta hydrolase [Candidatus Sigynarchaeota archaeon]